MRFVAALLLTCISALAHSQRLSQFSFASGSSLSGIGFSTDQGALIRVSDDGKVLEWGVEMKADRGNYYAPKLQPFMGRVEYHSQDVDSAFRGKVKSIGTCALSYFGSYEPDGKPGKVKTIGGLSLDYYGNYDNPALRGKLKSAGGLSLDYYSSAENEAYRGKLKSVGSGTTISYYSAFEDKLIRGKLKAIGGTQYTWYTSRDRREYQGVLKSGNYRQLINGFTFILRQ